MYNNNAPMDVLERAKNANVPNFKRVDNVKICYFCKFNKYAFKKYETEHVFYCSKYDFPFGTLDEIPRMVEFTCSDWELDTY